MRNADGYPPWTIAGARAPAFVALTLRDGQGDRWVARTAAGGMLETTLSDVVERTANAFIELID